MRLLPTNLVTELRTDIVSAKSLPALTAGFTTGLGLLVAQLAFATFIFSGPLAPYSSQGVGLVLFGNFAGCLVVALTGGYRGAVAGLSPALVIVMALIATSMDGDGKGLFVNTAFALILGAVIAGTVCLLIGRFRLANLVRFIPYPVAAGFVAGIGAVVCLSAVSMMGVELSWRTLPALLEPSALWKWTPGVLFGLALYAAMKYAAIEAVEQHPRAAGERGCSASPRTTVPWRSSALPVTRPAPPVCCSPAPPTGRFGHRWSPATSRTSSGPPSPPKPSTSSCWFWSP